jgi:hypothetical protein
LEFLLLNFGGKFLLAAILFKSQGVLDSKITDFVHWISDPSSNLKSVKKLISIKQNSPSMPDFKIFDRVP